AYPSIERLAKLTGDTTHFFIRDGDFAVCAGMVIGSYPVKTIAIQVGDRRPLGVGASSLAILSALPKRESDELIENYTRNPPSLGFGEVLAADIQSAVVTARKVGHSLNEWLVVNGMTCIGVPIILPGEGPIMALS